MTKHNPLKNEYPKDIIPELYNCINTFPCSTAQYERGFNLLNLVCTDLRYKLTVGNIANLMFLNINGSPLHLWNPEPYVKSWLVNQHRSADDNRTKTCKNVEKKYRYAYVQKKFMEYTLKLSICFALLYFVVLCSKLGLFSERLMFFPSLYECASVDSVRNLVVYRFLIWN